LTIRKNILEWQCAGTVSRWNGVALLQRITRHGNEDLMKAFVGADIGTTGIRASVYDERFQAIGSGGGESILHRGPDGSITQDPEEIFRETAKAVCEAVAASGVHARDVAGLSFDGQMAGILGIDEGWKAVTPYDSWLDTRHPQDGDHPQLQPRAQDPLVAGPPPRALREGGQLHPAGGLRGREALRLAGRGRLP
jgi:hypothetical protein